MREEIWGSSDVALTPEGGRKPRVVMTLPGAIWRRATWGREKWCEMKRRRRRLMCQEGRVSLKVLQREAEPRPRGQERDSIQQASIKLTKVEYCEGLKDDLPLVNGLRDL